MFINGCTKLKMNGFIEMQNTVVIIIITGITNVVGIIGFHHFALCYLELAAEKTQVFPLKKGKVL